MEKDNKKALSIEQMQYLNKLGVDLSNCSMEWCIFYLYEYAPYFKDFIRNESNKYIKLTVAKEYKVNYDLSDGSMYECGEIIPAFTVQDIIELVSSLLDEYTLSISKVKNNWRVIFIFKNGYSLPIKETSKEELIDTLYEMLVWLIKNDYLNSNFEGI